MARLTHSRASHYFLDLLKEQSIRRHVLMQLFSTTKGKFTKAIHMDASPFIIALFVRWQYRPFGYVLPFEADPQPVNSSRHWSLVTIAPKSTLKWPGCS